MTQRRAATWLALILTASTAAVAPRPAEAGKARKKRLIVSFRDGTGRAERASAARDMGLTLSDDLDKLNVSVLEAGDDVAPQDVAKARSHPRVVMVEEDVYRTWIEAPVSFQGAPLLGIEEAWQALGRPRRQPLEPSGGAANVPWGVARVNAPAAWSGGRGAGVKVAVIDTGIDCTHPDLQCDFRAGINLVAPGTNPMDDNRHGTHVSGTIAGRGKNGAPLGVAPKATLIPVKVLDGNGGGSLSDIIKGITWAANAGVDVINMSLGGPNGSTALERAVADALKSGVVIVAASGNTGPGPDTVGYPARYPGVIAVAASDEKDAVAKFSSRGDAVAFIAPGVGITSIIPGGGTAKLSGTSMAAPHVAGLAALAVERGAKGPAAVRAAFTAAASEFCTPTACAAPSEAGAGMIDAAKLR